MSEERTVALTGVDADKVAGVLGSEVGRGDYTADAVGSAVPVFVPSTFKGVMRAEHAVVGPDLVIHFFLPAEAVEAVKRGNVEDVRRIEDYWLRRFPAAMSDAAEATFHATKPRVIAKYTEEQGSWWLRAGGFGQSLDPGSLAQELYAAIVQLLVQPA